MSKKARRNINIREDLIEKAEQKAYENGLDFNGYISFLIANDGKQQYIPFPQTLPLSIMEEEEAPTESYTEEDMDDLNAMLDM